MADDSSQCPIMVGNDDPISIQDNEPDEKFDTSLRVLEVLQFRADAGIIF